MTVCLPWRHLVANGNQPIRTFVKRPLNNVPRATIKEPRLKAYNLKYCPVISLLSSSEGSSFRLASPRGHLEAAAPPTLPQLGPEIRVNVTSLINAVGEGSRGDRLAKSSGINVRHCVTAYRSLQR